MKKIDKNDSLLKYGGYASVMTAIVVVAVIVINLIVSGFNVKFDLTKNGLYTLSEDTVSLIEGLDEDVNVYTLYADGQELSVVTEILDRYASHSRHIKVSNVDPYTDPSFSAKYAKNGQQPTVGDVVVEAGGSFSIIPQSEVTDIGYDSASKTAYITGVKIEGVLTGTICQLTNGVSEVIYELTGHGETALGDSLKTELGYSGFSVNTLDLVQSGKMPDDCEILVINGPVTDLSSKESETIKAYLENGGKAFITLTIATAPTPNFDSVLAAYGVGSSGRLVLEGSANFVIENNPLYILPQLNSESKICSSIVSSGTNILMPVSIGIDRLDAKRSTVNIDTVASSSIYSYSKSFEDLNSIQPSETDPTGPIDLAVSITDADNNGTADGTKLIVASTTMILDDQANTIINGGNFGFVMNAFDFLNGTESAGRTKSIGAQEYLNITQSQAIVVMIVSVVVIPLAILIIGFAVFIRRRNK